MVSRLAEQDNDSVGGGGTQSNKNSIVKSSVSCLDLWFWKADPVPRSLLALVEPTVLAFLGVSALDPPVYTVLCFWSCCLPWAPSDFLGSWWCPRWDAKWNLFLLPITLESDAGSQINIYVPLSSPRLNLFLRRVLGNCHEFWNSGTRNKFCTFSSLLSHRLSELVLGLSIFMSSVVTVFLPGLLIGWGVGFKE